VEFRPHQEDAIQKAMRQNGNLLLSHPVGSGKTVTAIGAFERLRQAGRATRALIVTPASLRKNFTDEGVHKFTTDHCTVFGNAQEVAAGQGRALDNPDPDSRYHVVSYDLFRAAPEAYIKASGADTVIYDELHKIKNIGATGKALKDARKFHRNFIGLTGSIVSNTPADLVPLIDAMTDGKHHLGTKENFERRFMTDDGKLQNTPIVRMLLNPYIHHVDAAASSGNMPVKETETIKVDMSPEQRELYQYVVGRMDPVTALKFRFGTSKLKTNDVNNIFNKMTQARQVSNAIHTVNKSVTLSESAERSPKIRKILDDVEDHLRDTPDGQVIIYSNMIHGGLDVIGQGLRDRGIDHGIFMGKGQPGSTEKSRTQAVSDYQAGKKKVILLSSAGGEGLNLGNTTFVANVDGHFNPEKIHQAEARGVRAGGQAHRAQADRKVIVRRYVTRVPLSTSTVLKDTMNLVAPSQIITRALEGQPVFYNPLKRERSPDEWAYEVAGLKDERNKALRGNLDKSAEQVPDSVEDMLDLLEAGVVARAEDRALPLVKEAVAKVDHKERRMAADRIPMQPHRLVKSDRVVMNAYMKEFSPHLEEATDPATVALPADKQLREQEYIAALRAYYREAAKGGGTGLSKATTDEERKKEVWRNAALAGGIGTVWGGTQGTVQAVAGGLPLTHSLMFGAGTAALLGGTFGGMTLWDGMRNPAYSTPATRARKTGKLTDAQMVQLLRGLEVQQKEEKTHRFAVGSTPRATTTTLPS
jgi:superfamily II DNA/RNA helicase